MDIDELTDRVDRMLNEVNRMNNIISSVAENMIHTDTIVSIGGVQVVFKKDEMEELYKDFTIRVEEKKLQLSKLCHNYQS